MGVQLGGGELQLRVTFSAAQSQDPLFTGPAPAWGVPLLAPPPWGLEDLRRACTRRLHRTRGGRKCRGMFVKAWRYYFLNYKHKIITTNGKNSINRKKKPTPRANHTGVCLVKNLSGPGQGVSARTRVEPLFKSLQKVLVRPQGRAGPPGTER